MKYFLAKTDPETYSIDDLTRDGTTVWDGVHNAQAIQAIREMQPDDLILIYHSGGHAAIVGLAGVTSEPHPDPQAKDGKSWVVDFKFVQKYDTPITLSEIKSSHLFDDWSLVRQGRLSTMTVPANFVEWLKAKQVL